MRKQIEVSVAVQVEATLRFWVDDPSEATPELIAEKLDAAQAAKDREGEDAHGIYYSLGEPFGELMFYDPNPVEA